MRTNTRREAKECCQVPSTRHIEEVNLGVRGGNYGWPYREGTFVTDTVTGYPLYGLPPDDAKYGYIYPVAQYDHVDATTSLGKAAIAGGYVYRGTAVPALAGRYLFGDIVRGRVFHVAVADLKLGSQATIQELRLPDSLFECGSACGSHLTVASPKGAHDRRGWERRTGCGRRRTGRGTSRA